MGDSITEVNIDHIEKHIAKIVIIIINDIITNEVTKVHNRAVPKNITRIAVAMTANLKLVFYFIIK